MPDEETEMKTMWSESLFDALYLALRKNREQIIKSTVKDLGEKGYDHDYLVSNVQQKLGVMQANRLRSVLGMRVAETKSAKAAATKQAEDHWAAKLLSTVRWIFGISDTKPKPTARSRARPGTHGTRGRAGKPPGRRRVRKKR